MTKATKRSSISLTSPEWTDMEPLAKPSGLPLQEHVDHVVTEGASILEQFPFLVEKFKRLTDKDLAMQLRGACLFHDEGKKLDVWQAACRKDFEIFRAWQRNNGGTWHDYKKAMNGSEGKHLRKVKKRHEIESLIRKQEKLSFPIRVAIAAHHNKLNERHEERWRDDFGEASLEIWKAFKREQNKFETILEFPQVLNAHFQQAGARSLLQLADRRASAKEELEPTASLTNFEYKFPHKEKRSVQQIVEQRWSDDLLLLRAPTGAGKTDAALLWASLQVEHRRADRLVIAMPTRFTSNALSIGVAKDLSETGLFHSSAWHNRFTERIREGELTRKEAKQIHNLARLLLTPVTVCTIDHLLMALTLKREDYHTTLFHLANSCVVIDEADFYDQFTEENILVLLEALNVWKVPVLLMSASLPSVSLEKYRSTGYLVSQIFEDKSDYERKRCSLKSITEYEKVDDLEGLLQQCLGKGNGIVYANTVDRAMEFYEWFKKKKADVVLYHSRFTEPHKKMKEEELLKRLGKTAWENKMAKGIAVLTQIGEMSVNISAEIMISELCPIDRLVQRAGRLTRFWGLHNDIGELHLIVPQKKGEIYPAPYGSFNLKEKRWVPAEFLVRTRELMVLADYSAKDWVELVDEVYSKNLPPSLKAFDNAKALKELFMKFWLIGPSHSATEDETETVDWKSRDMGFNQTVFVEYFERKHFYSWSDFFEFKADNSIDLPIYMIQKGLKVNAIASKFIEIGGDRETVFYGLPGAYSFEKGFHLKGDSFL